MGIEIGVNESQPLEVVFEEISSGIEVSVDENPVTVDLQTPPEIQVSINEVCVYENTSSTEYNQLHNLPRINNVELIGNKTGSQLGLQNSESGKGLSSNDFTNSYKNTLDTHPIDYNNPHKTSFSNIEGYPSIPTNNRFLRDDKTFAEIVASSGGYAANVYLTNLNSDISTYKKISYSVEATETIVSTIAANESKLIYNYIYDSGVGVTNLDAGSWDFFFNCKLNIVSGSNRIKTIIFKRDISNIETDLITTYSSELVNTDYLQIRFQNIQQNIPVLATDRIGVRVFFETTNTNPTTLSLKVGDGNASYFTTPLALKHSQLRLPNEDVNVQHLTNAEKAELHSHSNKTVLDSIIQSSIDAWNIAYNWVSSNGAAVLSHIADSSIHVTSTLLSTINNKVDKVEGKGLSTNDFTNEQKELLSQQSGVNTGDQDLSGLEPKRGTDDFYVTNAEKTQGALATGNTVLPTVKDVADNLELIGTNFTISLNFVELYSSDFFNEVDFKIVNIETNPTQLITIIVNNVAYTIGNTISKFDKVTITPSITGYVILNCEVV